MPSNPPPIPGVRALLEWEKGKSFSDEILHTSLENAPLPPLDRAFFMETFFGILRNLSRMDFLIGRLREGPVDANTRRHGPPARPVPDFSFAHFLARRTPR